MRIESGQLGIRHQPVSLAQVVEDAEDLMAGLLTQRRQMLRIALPDDLPAITGDAPRLTQVVTNLLANASKFGPEDSEIAVGAARRARPVELWVEDSGPGVPELEGQSIFERFYRAADRRSPIRAASASACGSSSPSSSATAARSRRAHRRRARTRFTVTLPIVAEAA